MVKKSVVYATSQWQVYENLHFILALHLRPWRRCLWNFCWQNSLFCSVCLCVSLEFNWTGNFANGILTFHPSFDFRHFDWAWKKAESQQALTTIHLWTAANDEVRVIENQGGGQIFVSGTKYDCYQSHRIVYFTSLNVHPYEHGHIVRGVSIINHSLSIENITILCLKWNWNGAVRYVRRARRWYTL